MSNWKLASIFSIPLYNPMIGIYARENFCWFRISSVNIVFYHARQIYLMLAQGNIKRAGEMARCLRALLIFQRTRAQIPAQHDGWQLSKSSFRGSDAFFWPLWALVVCGTQTCMVKILTHLKYKWKLKKKIWRRKILSGPDVSNYLHVLR